MDGEGALRRKIGWWAVAVLSLVGIAVLGASGLVGLLVLALAITIATVMVVRA